MEIERLTAPQDERLTALLGLMERAFPREERREALWHRRAMADGDFYCCRVTDESRFIGLVCYWVHGDLVYLEHLAMAAECRNRGYGARVLEELHKRYAKFIIIAEVELPVDELTRRRCGFYERLGYRRLPEAHVQLPYHPDTAAVPLLLYAHASRTTEEIRASIPGFEHYLHERVMRYRDECCHP